MGLFTWDKPSFACLATRIPTGVPLSEEKLRRAENAESCLFSLGLRDFGVRELGNGAKIEVTEKELPPLM